jgi:hypothetical protein
VGPLAQEIRSDERAAPLNSILDLPWPEAVLATRQQPGGDTPGVAAAPVALAGVIVPGVARFIVVLSAHADVFGVGMTAIVGSMLVPPSCAMSC